MKNNTARWAVAILLLVLLVFPIAAAAAQSGSTTTLYLPVVSKVLPKPVVQVGPEGGTFPGVAVNPANANIIYAGSYGAGMYKSEDAGLTWQAINNGLTNLLIQTVSVTPDGGTVYAGTYGSGIFRSQDGGENWTAVNVGVPPDKNMIVYDIELDPVNPATMYATMRQAGTYDINRTMDGYAFKSTNGGDSWQQIWSGWKVDSAGDYSYDIDVTPNGQTLYLAVHEHGVYRSPADATLDSWTRSTQYTNTSGTIWPNPRNVAIDPQTPAMLYQSVYFNSDGMYKSTNGGDSWAIKNTGLAKPIYGYALAIDPVAPATLYLGTAYDGVYKSTDRADAWSNIGLYSRFIWDLEVKGDRIYAGTGGGGVQYTGDGGANWSPRHAGILNTTVTGLANFNGALYAGVNGGGVYRSINQGVTWQPVNDGLADLTVQNLLVLSTGSVSKLYALTGTQLFSLSSGSSTWTVAYTRTNAQSLAPQMMEAKPFGQNNVLPEEERQLLGLDSGEGLTFAAGPSAAYGSLRQITAAAVFGNALWIGAYNGGVSKSNGECAMYDGRTIYALHVSNADGRLYGSFKDSIGRDSVSYLVSCTDWNSNHLPGDQLITNFASTSVRTFGATAVGVYYRPKSEDKWYATNGYAGAVYAITVDPGNQNRLYAATAGGAYLSTDGGLNWAQAPKDELKAHTFLSVKVDAANPNIVYFGSKNGSTYRWDQSQ